MDTTKRLTMKALTWQMAGLAVMTLVGLIFTGSISTGGSIAVVGSIAGFFSYFFHELAWSKVKWGRAKN